LPDARNVLSCSKANAFYPLKKEGNRLIEAVAGFCHALRFS
jgi:hypothetical protein